MKLHLFPSAIAVFNFAEGDEGPLAQAVSAHPGEPVLFLSTRFNREVFSQAENNNRTFVFLRGAVNPSEVSAEYPAQWVSAGDELPGLPGNLTVEATSRGFKVSTLAPDPAETQVFE